MFCAGAVTFSGPRRQGSAGKSQNSQDLSDRRVRPLVPASRDQPCSGCRGSSQVGKADPAHHGEDSGLGPLSARLPAVGYSTAHGTAKNCLRPRRSLSCGGPEVPAPLWLQVRPEAPIGYRVRSDRTTSQGRSSEQRHGAVAPLQARTCRGPAETGPAGERGPVTARQLPRPVPRDPGTAVHAPAAATRRPERAVARTSPRRATRPLRPLCAPLPLLFCPLSPCLPVHTSPYLPLPLGPHSSSPPPMNFFYSSSVPWRNFSGAQPGSAAKGVCAALCFTPATGL